MTSRKILQVRSTDKAEMPLLVWDLASNELKLLCKLQSVSHCSLLATNFLSLFLGERRA